LILPKQINGYSFYLFSRMTQQSDSLAFKEATTSSKSSLTERLLMAVGGPWICSVFTDL